MSSYLSEFWERKVALLVLPLRERKKEKAQLVYFGGGLGVRTEPV